MYTVFLLVFIKGHDQRCRIITMASEDTSGDIVKSVQEAVSVDTHYIIYILYVCGDPLILTLYDDCSHYVPCSGIKQMINSQSVVLALQE